MIRITDNVRITHYFTLRDLLCVSAVSIEWIRRISREKAATCLKLALGLSWKNPNRFRVMDMAENFQRRAAELEAQAEQQRQQSQPRE